MGSLMAGWDSPSLDPKVAKYKRNKSFTRDEIEAFWKSKKQAVEEHLKASPENSQKMSKVEEKPAAAEKKYLRSNSMPLPARKSTLVDDIDRKKPQVETKKTSCWWTTSNWAYLNEAPVIEAEDEVPARNIRKQRSSFFCGQHIGEQKLENSNHHIAI